MLCMCLNKIFFLLRVFEYYLEGAEFKSQLCGFSTINNCMMKIPSQVYLSSIYTCSSLITSFFLMSISIGLWNLYVVYIVVKL